MNPLLAFWLGSIFGFAGGFMTAGRLTETELEFKSRAEWFENQLLAANDQVRDLQEQLREARRHAMDA